MPSLRIAEWSLKRMFSKRRTLLITLVLPALIVSAFLMLLHVEEQEKPSVSIVTHDHSPLAEYLVHTLQDKFTIEQLAFDEELRRNVFQRNSVAGIIIPLTFEETVLKGGLPAIEQVQLSTSEAAVALRSMLNQQLHNIVQLTRSARIQGWTGKEQSVAVMDILNEQAKNRVHATVTHLQRHVSPTFRISMGIFLMFMLLSSMNHVAMMMEDKQNYTMRRIYAAPVRRWEIAWGQFLGGFIFGTLQIAITLLITRGLLDLSMSMTLLQQWILLELFLLVSMGMACMLGAMIGNPEQFSRINFAFIVPTCMLGGCYWPMKFMHDHIQKIAYFIPQRWALDAMELLANGGSWNTIVLHMVVLILFGIVSLGFGSTILRPGKRETI